MDFEKFLKNKFFYIIIFSFIFFISFYLFFFLINEKKNIIHPKFFFVDYPLPPKWHYLYRNNSNFKKKEVKCPENKNIILILGQSNSGNHVKSKYYNTEGLTNFYLGKCYVLSEPVKGATGYSKSITSAIASKLINKQNYIFLNNSWAGTTILDWASNNESSLTLFSINELRSILSKGNNLKYVIWIQGESDSANFGNLNINNAPPFLQTHGYDNYYFVAFNILKEKIISAVKNTDVTFIITQSTICNSKRNKVINNQQIKLSTFKNIFTLSVTDNLDNFFRYDGCHLNEHGVEKVSSEISKLINNLDL